MKTGKGFEKQKLKKNLTNAKMYIACESVRVWMCVLSLSCVRPSWLELVDDLGLAQVQKGGVTSFLFEHPAGWSTRTTRVLLCGPSGWKGREAGKGGENGSPRRLHSNRERGEKFAIGILFVRFRAGWVRPCICAIPSFVHLMMGLLADPPGA